MVRALSTCNGAVSVSNHLFCALSKSFTCSLVVFSVTKNDALGGEKQNESNGDQSLQSQSLKPTIVWPLSCKCGTIPCIGELVFGKGADIEKQNCLFGVNPRNRGNKLFLCTSCWFLRFHVDKLSSAHVYVRQSPNKTVNDIPEDVVRECSQLVKENSIEGALHPFMFHLNKLLFENCIVCDEVRGINYSRRKIDR